MLSIASSHCILTISRDFYPKIRRRLNTETTRLDLERPNSSDSQVYSNLYSFDALWVSN